MGDLPPPGNPDSSPSGPDAQSHAIPSPPAASAPAAPAAPKGPRSTVPVPNTGKRIRSMPAPVRSGRVLSTNVADYASDMNWRRGVTMLWVLFGIAGAAEVLNMVFCLFRFNGAFWPAGGDIIRWCIVCAGFLALWIGWGWTRWPLSIASFLYGAWFIIMVLSLSNQSVMAAHGGYVGPGENGHNLLVLPMLLTGVTYLLLAFYLPFSGDVIGFVKHRREEGRGWVVGPVALLLAGFVALLMAGSVLFAAIELALLPGATDFGQESLAAMSAEWDPAAYESRADPAFLDTWKAETRKLTFHSLSPLGPLKDPGPHMSVIHSSLDGEGPHFLCDYNATRATFAHGRAQFGMTLTRGIFGPWKIMGIDAGDFKFDPPVGQPPASSPPDATPTPPAAESSPAAAALPGAPPLPHPPLPRLTQ